MAWDRDSIIFKIAKKMLWDPDGFPEKYYDERIQFQVLYDWLIANIAVEYELNFPAFDLTPQDPFSWKARAENKTDVEQNFDVDLTHKITRTDSTTITFGQHLGYEYSLKFEAKCLFGGAESQHKVNVDLNFEQGRTQETSTELSFGQTTSVRVLPHTTVIASCLLTPFQGSAVGNIKVTADQRDASAKCHIKMNYGEWDLQLENLPMVDRTFEYQVEARLTEYVYDITWKPATDQQMVPAVINAIKTEIVK